MKLFITYLVLFITTTSVYSQKELPTEAINGTYHLLEGERGIGNKKTKTKIFQYGMFGKDKVLAIAACTKCMPAIYKYKEAESKELGIPVFYNDFGIFVIAYDDESFISLKLSNKENADWTEFLFSNFYSKNKMKVSVMTQKKIKEFVINL